MITATAGKSHTYIPREEMTTGLDSSSLAETRPVTQVVYEAEGDLADPGPDPNCLLLVARLTGQSSASSFSPLHHWISIESRNRKPTVQGKPEDPVIALLDDWTQEHAEYDRQAWPVLKNALEEHRLSSRARFDE